MARKRRRSKELFYVDLRIAGGVPLFVHSVMSRKILNGLQWCCDKRGLRIYDYSLLPRRLMMIADTAWGSLADVLESYKTFSSKAVMLILRNGRSDLQSSWMLSVFREFGAANNPDGIQIWEEDSLIRSAYKQEQIDEYALKILHQAVKMGLVEKPEHYLNCSAHPKHPLAGWIVEAVDPWS